MRRLLQIGEAQKRRAATALNDRSTRAHSIFILTLKQRLLRDSQSYSEIEVEGSGLTTLTSKLFLADLGGSEQVKKSKVEAGKFKSRLANNNNNEELSEAEARDQALYSTGFEMAERMREAVYINLGLLALKKCIEALNSKCSYVPYQVNIPVCLGVFDLTCINSRIQNSQCSSALAWPLEKQVWLFASILTRRT